MSAFPKNTNHITEKESVIGDMHRGKIEPLDETQRSSQKGG